MSSTKAEFIAQGNVENAATNKFTASGTGAIIDEFTMTNYSGGSVNVDIYIGTSAVDANRVIHTFALASHATKAFSELVGRYIKAGDSIFWLAGAATSVSGHASGRNLTS